MWRVKAESPARKGISFGQINDKSGSRNFLRSLLRSGKILMQDCATLRNALRKRNYEIPSVSNDMQSSETLRNSLGLNYKSNQLSYAGIAHTKAVFSEFIKQRGVGVPRR